jgi:hypothetical protein
MKRLFLLAAGLLTLILLSTSGCTEDTISPSPGIEISSSCVTCHTDEELLQQLAVEEEEGGSEQTTGEG